MVTDASKYFVPEPSRWPIFGSIALLLMAFGATMWINREVVVGPWVLAAGAAVLVYMLFGWFGGWSMSWFIFSEVMFFAAFFGALFYMRVLSVPWLADFDSKLIWPDFTATWPVAGPGLKENFTPMGAMGIPALNTLLLLSSAVTVTWAHWGLKKNNRGQLVLGLALTIILGITFLGFQAYEYGHAYSELNLKLSTGAYGSTFYMLTGFHGLHVTLGTIMLIVIFFRSVAGHFTPERHFGFEAVSWYWHFVDYVWILLFIFVYWLV